MNTLRTVVVIFPDLGGDVCELDSHTAGLVPLSFLFSFISLPWGGNALH